MSIKHLQEKKANQPRISNLVYARLMLYMPILYITQAKLYQIDML